MYVFIEQSDNHKKWQPDYPRKYVHITYAIQCTYTSKHKSYNGLRN